MTFKQSFALWIGKIRAAVLQPGAALSDELPPAQSDEMAQLGGSIQQLESSPWRLSRGQMAFLLLFALTAGLILFLRLFRLDTLQSEVYADIDIVRDFVRQVLVGGWPTKFNLSAGPLYAYLITPVIWVSGLNYLGLKLASVLVSLACLAAAYAFSRRLFNDWFALLVVFVAGSSSWLLIFSRLGNSQILLPLLTMLALWLAVRTVQFGRRRDVAACAALSALGLFVYPQSFVLAGVIFVTLLCLHWTGKPLPRGWIPIFILTCIPFLLFFAQIVASDPSNFTSGYLGNKIAPGSGQSVVGVLAGNFTNAMLALHVRGDGNFRSNPNSLPHLDWISGILFLAGIVFWFVTPERRRWVPLWLVPLVLLQVPSMLVLNQPDEVPSASRTLGAAPIVYLLVASGLWWLLQALLARGRRRLAVGVVSLLLACILTLNIQRYFRTYLNGLPYSDTPIAHNIASYANSLPEGTHIYMVGCCWEQGMPELFVKYDMIRPDSIQYVNAADLSCTQLQSVELPAVFIWSFHDNLPAPQLEACQQWLPAQLYTDQGRPVFYAAPLRPDSSAPLTSSQAPPPMAWSTARCSLTGRPPWWSICRSIWARLAICSMATPIRSSAGGRPTPCS